MPAAVRPISSDSLALAAQLLRTGELVAFPTETVYGLGANAFDEAAVHKIFAAKGRPSDNPLIVHIASFEQLNELVLEITEDAKKLMDAFWPGPLTIIFRKSEKVPDAVTAGGKTIAIRWPSHPVALQLIRAAGVPIAAPSANASGKPSPTQAVHVFDDLQYRIPLILDGGASTNGLESTVLDVTSEVPALLRPGGVSLQEIEKVLGKALNTARKPTETPRSPGMKYRHYAPKAQVIILEDLQPAADSFARPAGYIGLSEPQFQVEAVRLYSSTEHMVHGLFSDFRQFDKKGIKSVFIKLPDSGPLSEALFDRVKRASQG